MNSEEEIIELQEVSEITNLTTPVSIFQLVGSKISQGDYPQAALAFGIGTGYAMYDMRRVPDPSAHQALPVLRMNAAMGFEPAILEQFQNAADAMFEEPEELIALLTQLGSPDYHPTYMVQHGMGAMLGEDCAEEFASDFEAEKAWQEILDGLKVTE